MDFSSYLEAFAAIFGLIATYLYLRGSYLTFVFTLGSTLPFVFIFFSKKIYAESLIHVYYSLMSVVGFFTWFKARKTPTQPYAYARPLYLLFITFLLILFFLTLYFSLRWYEDAAAPFLDALATSIAMVAMIMGVQKKIDNWALWIASDILSVFLFFQTKAYFAAFQFFVLIFFGIWGWRVWHTQYKRNQEIAAKK